MHCKSLSIYHALARYNYHSVSGVNPGIAAAVPEMDAPLSQQAYPNRACQIWAQMDRKNYACPSQLGRSSEEYELPFPVDTL
jgi:hypothetical protein